MDSTPTGLRLETVTTLDKVTPEDWDALAEPEGFYMSHGWLRAVERESGATATYLLAYAGDRLVGGLPVYDVERENNKFYAVRPRLDQMGTLGEWGVAGSHRGHSSGILRSPTSPGGEDAVLDLLLGARRKLSPPTARGSVFLFATNRTASALHQRGAAVDFDCGDATLHTEGREFADYCGDLSSHRRIALKAEYARFRAAGYELDRQRLSECLDEAAPLLANLQAKYGHATTADEVHRTFTDQAACLDDRSVVFTVRIDGRLVGASVTYEWYGTLYVRAVGFDYAALRGAFEYYALCYYLPIDYMSERGLTALHLGIGAYGAKVKRGCRLTPLWTVAVADDPADTPRLAPLELTSWRKDHGGAVRPEHWNHPWTRPLGEP